jgi:pimeloyl-ACP methyl ester carboxylesterase
MPTILDTKPGSHSALGPAKQIDAGLLNVGYVESGPPGGPPVILLHGWPYDIQSYADVAPALAEQGYRVIVPYLRGFGTTRLLATEMVRNGQQAIIAVDLVNFMDALKIQRAILGGFDWGGRAADCVAALWPDRCKALVAVSGNLVINLEANKKSVEQTAEVGWWYQYYFATPRGLLGYQRNTHDFAKLIWKLASPKWHFDDATFERSAPAFENPDHAAIVVHNYRWRLSLAKGEPKYADLEQRLASSPVISVPTVTIGSDFDGVAAEGSAWAKQFSGPHVHRTLRGIGHNVPQEDPRSFAQAIVDADTL